MLRTVADGTKRYQVHIETGKDSKRLSVLAVPGSLKEGESKRAPTRVYKRPYGCAGKFCFIIYFEEPPLSRVIFMICSLRGVQDVKIAPNMSGFKFGGGYGEI